MTMKPSFCCLIVGMSMCASCIELGVENPGGTSSSSGIASSSSSSGEMGGAGGQGSSSGTGGIGGSPAAPFCDSNDSTLIACFEFEGDAMDHSSKANATSVAEVTYAPGIAGQAASFGGMSQVAMPNSPAWNISAGTAELWYYQRTYSPTRMGLVDSDNRLGLFVYGQGELHCSRGVQYFVSHLNMPLNTWTHVACVFDGALLSLYVDGTLVGTTMAPAISTGGTTAIGSNAPSGDGFDGLIDNVRVWNVPRSATQICQSAGKQGC